MIINEDEFERIADLSQELFNDDRLEFLIDDGLDLRLDTRLMWRQLQEKTLELAGWNHEPPLPWTEEQFRHYWTCRAEADAVDGVCRIAERDLELFWDGNEEPLMASLRSIAAQEDRSRLEGIYLRTVLNTNRLIPQTGR
jgi:hypothetical protein